MKPTNTQQAVLQSAAKHPQRMLLELPGNLKGGARTKVLHSLIKSQWIEPCGSEPDAYVITPLGLQVIGQTPDPKPNAERVHREGTKQAALIALLKQPAGATLAQMVQATGWQSHTVRGAMAGGLKKKLGLEITSDKQPGAERIYRIISA
jgi:Protein of unknown function (DUF3489)